MDIIILFLIVIVAIALFFAGFRNEQHRLEQYRDSLQTLYGKAVNRRYGADELKAIKGYHNSCDNQSAIDDITWNDLDMWSVYKKMNYCQSSAGDEYLYHLLKSPRTSEYDFSEFEKDIELVSSDENARLNFAICFYKMGRSGKFSIFDYIDVLDKVDKQSLKSDLIVGVLYIPAIVLCFFNGLLGAASILILLIISISTYFRKKSVIQNYISGFSYVLRMLDNAKTLTDIEALAFSNKKNELSSILKNFGNFKRLSFLVTGAYGNGPLGVLLDYFKMITHLDLIKFNSMLEQFRLHREDIKKLLAVIGYMDTIISISYYRKYLDIFAVPELTYLSKSLSITQGYHPLMENAVKNSIDTDKGIILTGSNASGKSTFLKMVAVNALLAQSIHTVCADSYNGGYFRIYSSLSLKDNIKSGDSYYMVEIKAIKRMFDAAAEGGCAVLGFVDEVLRGTNTTERIAASSTILTYLNNMNALVFAATHDLELANILKDKYDNYHFEEEMTDNDVKFPYKLCKGKATGKNAIRLLGVLGFEHDITEYAENMVKCFDEKGYWI